MGSHDRSICPPKFEDRSEEETFAARTMRPQRRVRNLQQVFCNFKEKDQATSFSSCGCVVSTSAVLGRSQKKIPVSSESFDAHAEHGRSEFSGTGHTFRVSRNPATVVTANGEVQTNEEATVHVFDFD